MAVCLRYANHPEQAQEILQDGFVKVFTKLSSYRGEGSVAAWVRRIMVHTALDHLREESSYRRTLKAYGQVHSSIKNSNNVGDANLTVQDLYRYLQTLPPMTRMVFNLFAIEGYSHAEISAQLQISTGTSQWHVSFARKTLSHLLAQSFFTC